MKHTHIKPSLGHSCSLAAAATVILILTGFSSRGVAQNPALPEIKQEKEKAEQGGADLSTTGQITAQLESKKPLDNRGLHQLRSEFEGKNKPVKIRGTEVSARVVISTLEHQGGLSGKVPRRYQYVMCEVMRPDKGSWNTCKARLINLSTGFYSNLKEGKEYWLEGMIMEDDHDDGHFWIYAFSLTSMKEPGGGKPNNLVRSDAKALLSVETLVSLVETDAADLTIPTPIQQPLDNWSLLRLRQALNFNNHGDEGNNGRRLPVKLWGTEVEARVVITQIESESDYSNQKYRQSCRKVWCKVLEPDEGRSRRYSFVLINLRPGFYSGLKKGDECLIKGIIATGHSCFGFSEVYANKLIKIE